MEVIPFTELITDCTKEATKLPKSTYQETGTIAIVDQGQDFIAGYTDESDGIFTKTPAIIFGDHTRVFKYVDFPFFIGADGVKVLKATRKINYKYLYYYFLQAKFPNTGYARHFKWLKELKIPVPSLEEQNNIAAQLDKCTTLIENYKQLLLKYDELIKSRFIEMFGDPVLNPKKWEIKKLNDISEYWNGLTYKPENVSDIGTIVLRSSNIQESNLDFNDIVRVNCNIKEKQFVKENDILMCSRNGSARLVGKVALIKEIKEPLAFGAFMMIIRSSFYPYLFTFFQTEAFRRQIRTGATTTVNQITNNMLDDIKLPLPPIELQKEFYSFVQQIDKSKFTIQQSLEKIDCLFNSLLQEYFDK